MTQKQLYNYIIIVLLFFALTFYLLWQTRMLYFLFILIVIIYLCFFFIRYNLTSGALILCMQQEKYRLRVRASDCGDPPSYAEVDIELDVVDRNNKPPLWERSVYGPTHIKENVTIGTIVISVKARFVFLATLPFTATVYTGTCRLLYT